MALSTLQRSLRTSLGIACVLALAYCPGVMAANCTFHYSTTKPVTLSFGAGLSASNLTIPQDAPSGTVIYEESLQQDGFVFNCAATFLFGFTMSPALGIPGNNNTYPLGTTGLSFLIKSQNPGLPTLSPPYNLKPGFYTSGGGTYTLQIFKSAELSLQNVVAAGELGQFKAGDLRFITFNLLKPITLNTASCQTPAVNVQMGDDYRLDEFASAGDTPRTIKFNIALNQCQRGIKNVTYQLKASTPVIDQKKGIVGLNIASSAKGIGLQLKNDAGQPIALDTPYPFNGFNTTGTQFNIPLSASYYRLANSTLEAGTANTQVTFIVSYL